MILPWHEECLRTTIYAPATLVVGHEGGGRDELALALAAAFIGEPTADLNHIVAALVPIKKADKKEWFADKNADILSVYPDKDNIPVDAVRKIIEFCSLSPITMPRRVAVIARAECLNTAAANALLKTLEEPAASKALILSARAAALLPPTIVSRCRILIAPPPDDQQSLAWIEEHKVESRMLAFCGGMPLQAAAADAKQVADAVQHFAAGGNLNIYAAAKTMSGFDGWLECLQKWVTDGGRAACGLSARYFPGREKHYVGLCANPRRWLDQHARLIKKRQLINHPLAADLFIKEILYDYRNMFMD